MTSLSTFNKFTADLKEQEQVIPALFNSHGSPNETGFGDDWALKMSETFKQLITSGAFASLINFENLGL